ncbi:tRNA (adenine(58)-N(1))-methyltransferase non-catalytic subunit trm6 [Lecanora helva]
MSTEYISPGAFVVLRLPSESHIVTKIQPNATISLGKYGSFQANHLVGRPYHLTFEILDRPKTESASNTGLRVVPPAELYASIKDDEPVTPSDVGSNGLGAGDGGVEYDIVGEDGEVVMRTNRQIIDDPNSQVMTMEEIEDMKKQNTGSGKDLVAKILESHSALDQKTAFALAKYTLRKTKKYLKRFTVLPLDVSALTRWMMNEKEPMKIMELREEMLALIGSWSNVHYTALTPMPPLGEKDRTIEGAGRWLVIDETAGLVVAYLAEKLGILHPEPSRSKEPAPNATSHDDTQEADIELDTVDNHTLDPEQPEAKPHQPQPHKTPVPLTTNTIIVLHSNAQPNLSLLNYFHFDPFSPTPSHPLSTHLKMISWLQLLAPEDDAGYTEPESVSQEVLQTWKSGKRGNYFRKRRRWERIKSVVDETRAGGFDGLIVASVMNPIGILRHTIPLLRGAAQVVIYSPTVESLVEVADYYSSARRTAFINNPPDPETMPMEDFPVNPTLLLAPTIHTARARNWQVLPGRTHPLMTGRGGAEGYVLTATRVLPAEGKVEARGKFKRRKVDKEATATGSLSKVDTPMTEEGVVE